MCYIYLRQLKVSSKIRDIKRVTLPPHLPHESASSLCNGNVISVYAEPTLLCVSLDFIMAHCAQ